MRARARTHTCDRGYAIASREIFRLPDFLGRSIVRPGKISKVIDLETVARSVKKKLQSVGSGDRKTEFFWIALGRDLIIPVGRGG